MTTTAWTLDHCSLTVPDLDAATAFFVEVVGARIGHRRTVAAGNDPKLMQHSFNAHPEAGFRLVRLQIGQFGLELFEYQAPDQRHDQPRNCDIGGSHLAFLVPHLERAVERAAAHPDVRILGSTQTLAPNHPLAGRRWIYLLTSWGQQIELVSDELRS